MLGGTMNDENRMLQYSLKLKRYRVNPHISTIQPLFNIIYTFMIFCLCWLLTSLSTIFQLYRGGQLYCWRKPEDPEKTTGMPQVTDTLLI
jgi:D-alanyl-lipoteichoic acid acyltransferase DltB (MBOAT superfamily)